MTSQSRNNPPAAPSQAPRWSRQQIRAARNAQLAPLLLRRGFHLIERSAGNLEVRDFPGLVVKESYWRWPERNLSGNAIDFLVKVLRMSFAAAMEEIEKSQPRQ